MYQHDVEEAAPIIDRSLAVLVAQAPARGRIGADLRTAVGDARANVILLLWTRTLGPALDNCFDLARQCGVTRPQMAQVRQTAAAMTPRTVGAITVRNAIIELSLAFEGRIIADTTFVRREEIEALKREMNEAFSEREEATADSMDSMTYRALIELHAAIMYYLIETGRPLPRMVRFQFANILSSLVMAHKLYGDAKRADELRIENRIVHPAFMQKTGRALSR
jgi:prophage DNA circulation protein